MRIAYYKVDGGWNPVRLAITIVAQTVGIQEVSDLDEADLIITFTPIHALELVKETEQKIMIALMPPERDSRIAAYSLAESYPDQIEVTHVVDQEPGDKLIVIRLMELAQKENS